MGSFPQTFPLTNDKENAAETNERNRFSNHIKPSAIEKAIVSATIAKNAGSHIRKTIRRKPLVSGP